MLRGACHLTCLEGDVNEILADGAGKGAAQKGKIFVGLILRHDAGTLAKLGDDLLIIVHMAVILLRSRRRCRRISPISLSFMVFPRLYVEMRGHYITSKRKNPVKIEGGRFRPPSSGYISGSALALQSLMVMRG